MQTTLSLCKKSREKYADIRCLCQYQTHKTKCFYVSDHKREGGGIKPPKALRILLPQRKKLTKNERSRGRVIPGPQWFGHKKCVSSLAKHSLQGRVAYLQRESRKKMLQNRIRTLYIVPSLISALVSFLPLST